MKFPEHRLAHQLLDGLQGLEIGAAAHNPFGLRARNVAPPDDFEFYASEQQKLTEGPAAVNLWGYADAIPVADDSEDYILSSHVVEHLPNVIQAFLEWNRVVRIGGLIFMIVPLRNAHAGDVGRPLTPLEHFIADFQQDINLDSHPVEGVPGGRMGHYHVFTADSLLAVVDWMRRQGLCDWELVAREDIDTKVGNGFTLAFRIRAKPQAPRQPEPIRSADDALTGPLRLLNRQKEELAEKDRLLTEATRSLADKDRCLEEFARQLRAEHEALGGQILARLRRHRNRLFPPESRRWRMYLLLRRPADRLLRQGLPGRLGHWLESGRRLGLALFQTLNGEALRRRAELARWPHQPRISLVTPVFNIDACWLRRMVQSVRRQVYPNWQLCLVNDGSTAPHIRAALDGYAARDPRIVVRHLEHNQGIAAASNHALALATGEFVGLLDHDDELTPDALFEVVRRLNLEPDLDLIYSDEDKLLADGSCGEPVLKPDWNRALLLGCNYISHFSVFRRSLLQEIGGFRAGFDGSQDYDLVLRFTERTDRVAHIPKVLYHWRVIPSSTAGSATAKPHAYSAARRALDEALERRGQAGQAEIMSPGLYKVRYQLPSAPRVAVILHQHDGNQHDHQMLQRLAQTERVQTERVLINTGAGPQPPTGAAIQVHYRPDLKTPGAVCNFAARQTTADFLVLLESDLEGIGHDWLAALLEQAQQPDTGAVGARILDADGRLAHAGLVLGRDGRPHSASAFLPSRSLNQILYTDMPRQCSAVTGCLLVRRKALDAVGGFDERFQRAYHDLDLCLRLRQAGWAVAYTPWAVLRRTQAAATVRSLQDERLFRQIWGEQLRGGDPFFHPRLVRRRKAA